VPNFDWDEGNKNLRHERIVIHREDEIPDHFDSEDAEREWWATHELSDELWDSLEDKTGELAAELDAIIPLPEGRRRSKASL
jgi:hypothetical protein